MMSHRETKPYTALQHNVRCIWTLEESQADFNRKDIIPDPYVEFCINVGAPVVWQSDSGATVELPRVFINPLQIKPLRLRATGPVKGIFVRLYPWAAYPFLDFRELSADLSIIPLDG